jgi:regulatory protein
MLAVPGPDSQQNSGDDSSAISELGTTVTIAALNPRGSKGKFFIIKLSDGQTMRLRAETVASRGLNVGDAVDATAVAAWEKEDSKRQAVEVGLNYVSYRPRSAKEVADHLRQKSLDGEASAHAIHRLQELGYLDDAAFARFWVESRDSHRPRGRRALAWELKQKGIADTIIEDVLERFAGDETNLAMQAARKRAANLETADAYKFRRQLGSFLARRGFGYDVVEDVVNDLWDELGAD